MKTEKISNAADKLRCIPSDLIEQKKETRVTATSNFKVESKNAYQNEVTCTDTAGKFSVMPTASTKGIYNSTTNFEVIPLRKHPKQAIQVDKVLASNFVDFKKTMLTGKNIKRESSSNLRKNKQKFNARQKAGKW